MSAEFNQEGLSTKEVIDRIERGERNSPIKPLTRSYNKIFKDNICTLFNLINIIIATLIIYTGSYKNLLFLGVLISNVSIGIFQEVRAKKSIDKLSLLNQSKITVIRDNQKSKINQHDLVKDDLMIINRGSQICADGVIVKTDGIEVDESQLTGESDPILKIVDSKVMSGSYVISGMAYVKVVNVGEESYASKIAMEAKKEKDINSQLIKTLKQIIKGLAFFIVPIGIALFLSKSNSGINTNDVILGVSAAMIGMIPEGLILITSIALAVEVVNLSKKKVLVKTMGSIENLARVDLLCLDKTGTITDGNIKLVDIITCEDFEMNKLKEGISTLVENLEENATSKALKVELPSPKSWKPINRVQFSSARKWSGVTFEKEGSYIMGAPEFVFEKYHQISNE
ncbi:HAD-IC family P-type ATPase [Paraclostridium sp. AKS73]|uniref:HAD-IC family P-type ATPase n=1 Tax=Paraclostridium sp. AKS73 TaxID=2876116 RepID=UPI0021E01ACE|nr:HAD-IC family P-type ATPase [Paraclostridium sp. AKS73]MCU9814381.1 HAD-IC family P-type ATPase [Paraclostridium sp. AKS73]